MTASDESNDEPVGRALRAWSGQPALCGCSFAGGPLKHVRVWSKPIDRQHFGTELTASLTVAAERAQFAMLAFPLVTTSRRLSETVQAISTCPGWGLWLRTGSALAHAFELLWLTAHGEWSSSLVVGPFPFFPATRRAPYTAILLWPTKRANTLTSNTSSVLGIGDAAPSAPNEREKYIEVVRTVRAQVQGIAAAPGAMATARDVSVYLAPEDAVRVSPSTAADPRAPST